MRTLPLFLGISSLLLAACGDDGGKAQDAGPQDSLHDTGGPADGPTIDSPPVDADPNLSFSCYQNTAPATAPATLSISGTVQTFGTGSGDPIAGATVKACKGDCTGNNVLATVESNATGAYTTGDLATGSVPLAGYIVATAPPPAQDAPDPGYFKTFVFPATPLASSLAGIPTPLITQDDLGQIALVIGTQDADKGVLALLVADCSSPYKGVIGATISVKEGGAEVGGDPFDVGGVLGDQAAGTYLMANVPPGNATITVTYAGMTFLTNTVIIEAHAATAAQIRPGY